MRSLIIVSTGLVQGRSHRKLLGGIDDDECLLLSIDVPLSPAASAPLGFTGCDTFGRGLQPAIALPLLQKPLRRRVQAGIGLVFEDRQKLLDQRPSLRIRPFGDGEFAEQKQELAVRAPTFFSSVQCCRTIRGSTPKAALNESGNLAALVRRILEQRPNFVRLAQSQQRDGHAGLCGQSVRFPRRWDYRSWGD